jgi:acyl-CoA synthetase (AMP-forming)/AMP-acid ligase II
MYDFSRLKSVADISRLHAADRPDAVALDFNDRMTTYRELDARASSVAQGLIALGARPGTRVGYLGKNIDRYFEVLFGAFKAGVAIVGVNWRLAAPEIAYILNDAGCEILFVGRDFTGVVQKVIPLCPRLTTIIAMDGDHREWPAYETWRDAQSSSDPMLLIAPDDDVIQLYTSGTTGNPKGVQLTNANYLAILECAEAMGLATYTPDDAVLIAMPFFHVAGVNIGVLALAQGARGIVLGDIDPQIILRLIESKRINYAFIVPAVILILMQQPNARTTDFSSLKVISYGASPIAEDLLRNAKDVMGCGFMQLYGLTETTGAGTCLAPDDHDPALGRLRSCGKPAPGMEVRVVDGAGRPLGPREVGEIQIKGPVVMKGYWNKADATRKSVIDHWFASGDAGYFDEDGYLYIHDRVKDMIVSGGENIYPAEVENAIFGHPAVADVAVIGVPDDKWGEAVKAVIVRKPGVSVSPEEIIGFARERIAGYKLPKSVDFVDALPRNPSGKILRRELRQPYWEGRERQVN